MDYEAIAKDAGCLDTAIEDTVRRCEAHFQGEAPTAEVVQQWLRTTLRQAAPHLFPQAETVWAKLGMDKATFDAMPASWRLGQGMAQQAQVTTPHPRRPVSKDAPQDVQAQWQDLSLTEKMTAYRAWRDNEG